MVVVRGLAEILALGSNAIAVVVASRAVGPTNFGTLALAAAIGQLGIIIGNAGISTYGSQRIASETRDQRDQPGQISSVWLAVVISRIVPSIVAATAGILAAALLVQDPLLRGFLYVVFPSLMVLPLKSEWFLVALGRIQAVAFVRAAGAIGTAILTVVLIRGEADADRLPLLFVVPLVVTATLSSLMVVRSDRAGQRARQLTSAGVMTHYVRSGWHYLKADASVFVYANSDRLFLWVLSGPTVLGLYDAAYKLLLPFYAVGAVVSDSMYQRLAHAIGRPSFAVVFRRWVDFMSVATVPAGFVCMAYSAWIIGLIYGEQFEGAAVYLSLLGWVITIGYLAGIITIPFTAWNAPREYANSIVAGGVTNLALNVALIPGLAGAGAALATIAAKAAVGIVGFRYFRRKTEYPVLRDFAFYLVASGASVLIASMTARLGIPIPAQIVLAGMTYAAMVGFFRLRPDRSEERQRVATP